MRAVWKQGKKTLLGARNWKMCIPFENSHLYVQRERNVLQRNQLPARVASMISSYSHCRVWESPGSCGGLGKGDERRGRRLALYFCAYVSGAFEDGEVLNSAWVWVIHWFSFSNRKTGCDLLVRSLLMKPFSRASFTFNKARRGKIKWSVQIITALELIGLKN